MSLKHQLRGAAIGIVAATTTVAAVYYFSSKTQATPPEEQALTPEDAIQVLKDADYEVLTEADYVIMMDQLDGLTADLQILTDEKKELEATLESVKEEAEQAKEKESDKDDEKEKEEEPETVYQTVLLIQPGMTSIDIGRQLAKMNVISDSQKFIDYMLDNELDRNIDLGEYYITSDMSTKEIAKLITK
ncbi:hypothetical protein SAMN05421736_102212 [Evansella caseinilytica]|uniref:YceG-like family protein n=1 Tax=Evansella caseinilytica TaxID=1503961 RepID=A0A1H3KQ90_9BACI|nr:hypothetical protein [Evansella caseinilytica]SDY53875.1 hypothetical protein SAMN05421736_102212 [Evansella caseinilytica]